MIDFLKLKFSIGKKELEDIVNNINSNGDGYIETDTNLMLNTTNERIMEITIKSELDSDYTIQLYGIYDDASDTVKFDSTRKLGVSKSFYQTLVSDPEEVTVYTIKETNETLATFLNNLKNKAIGNADDVEILVRLSDCEDFTIISSEKCKEYKVFGFNPNNNSHVFAIKEDCNISYEDEISTDYRYKLMDWLTDKENKDVQQEMDKFSDIDAKMNYLGKWLLSQKMNGDIDQQMFLDLFVQAGTIGYSDNKLSMIYEIIK